MQNLKMELYDIAKIANLQCQIPKDILINNIEIDSRKATKGSLFIDLSKSEINIKNAIDNGASAIFTELNNININNVFYINSDIKNLAGEVAKKFYKTDNVKLIAVTGTNGKTSTVHYVRSILEKLGQNVASMGSLGINYNNNIIETDLNTPDVINLHKNIRKLINENIDIIAFEASSHGIDQKRISGIKPEVAAFTSFSHDHLDYHKNMDNYFEAKAKLFYEYLPEGKYSVVNAQMEIFDKLKDIILKNNRKIITYGFKEIGKSKNIEIISFRQDDGKLYAKVSFWDKKYDLELNLFGVAQLFNILCAIGIISIFGYNLDKIINILPSLNSPAGRMELINVKNRPLIFVDYSHKPAALENILKAVKETYQKKITLIFGCGGNRDTEKRPIMGEIAQKYADKIIITDDNPRFEDASLIRASIIRACPKALEIPNRKEAIIYGINNTNMDEILIVAGRGGENYQYIRDQKIPFNDSEFIKKILNAPQT